MKSSTASILRVLDLDALQGLAVDRRHDRLVGPRCIGLHFWLRMKPFYQKAAPFLLAVARADSDAFDTRPLSRRARRHGQRQPRMAGRKI